MGNFFAELKRRSIDRAAAAHAVVAWLLLQVCNHLTPVLKLRDWAGALVLVIGFPVALILAWILRLTSADFRCKQEIRRDGLGSRAPRGP
jgi:hypothetical protein